jgi:hypothetical protein
MIEEEPMDPIVRYGFEGLETAWARCRTYIIEEILTENIINAIGRAAMDRDGSFLFGTVV